MKTGSFFLSIVILTLLQSTVLFSLLERRYNHVSTFIQDKLTSYIFFSAEPQWWDWEKYLSQVLSCPLTQVWGQGQGIAHHVHFTPPSNHLLEGNEEFSW
jgi:hypothetical protein